MRWRLGTKPVVAASHRNAGGSWALSARALTSSRVGLPVELVDQREVDRTNFFGQPVALVVVELIPEGQEVFLSEGGDSSEKVGFHGSSSQQDYGKHHPSTVQRNPQPIIGELNTRGQLLVGGLVFQMVGNVGEQGSLGGQFADDRQGFFQTQMGRMRLVAQAVEDQRRALGAFPGFRGE